MGEQPAEAAAADGGGARRGQKQRERAAMEMGEAAVAQVAAAVFFSVHCAGLACGPGGRWPNRLRALEAHHPD
jgi:hypothetical protein